MVERTKQAFEFAADAAKQIITLSTAILALTITFLKDVLNSPSARSSLLGAAWIFYLLAVLAGIWALLALTGSLGDENIKDDELSVYSPNSSIPFIGMLVCFAIAVILTVWFGWQRF